MTNDSMTVQVCEAYRQGMSPAEIAEELNHEELAVKACLLQFCTEYRQSVKKVASLEFSDSDEEVANTTIRNTMHYSEDEHLRFRAACRVKDEKRGRLDAIKNAARVTISLSQFNIDIQKAREAHERAKRNIIDVAAA